MTNNPNEFSGYDPEGGYADDRSRAYGPPHGYGPEYSAGMPPQRHATRPPRPSRNRLWYVLGGLTALMIIGCIGLTALGIVVGKDERIQANTVAANEVATSAAPVTTQSAQEAIPAEVATTAPTTAASTVPPAPAATTASPAARATLTPEVELPPTEEVIAPARIKVPNLKGRNAAEADDVLRKLGFTNVTYGSADPYDTLVIMLPNWTVKKQSVKSGAKILPDTMIVLTCSKK